MLGRTSSLLFRSRLASRGASCRFISSESLQMAENLNKSLNETDPELFEIMELEKKRQRNSLVLIASENFTSKSVYDALGSHMSNK